MNRRGFFKTILTVATVVSTASCCAAGMKPMPPPDVKKTKPKPKKRKKKIRTKIT